MRKSVTFFVLFIVAMATFGADKPKELFKEVNASKSQRLMEYNSVFLKKALYQASRHRIVKVNTKLLLKDDDFIITLFDGESIQIKQKSVERKQDIIYWNAYVDFGQHPELNKLGFQLSTLIGMFAWDLDESGRAILSMQNRFKHSPYWEIDEFDNPFLGPPPVGEVAIVGPPPSTPEEIAQHKRLKKLKKHKFYSVQAIFQVLRENSSPAVRKYVLKPLKYTPKYSVIYELDPNKFFMSQIDPDPGEERDLADQQSWEAYDSFVRNLPKESNKVVKGDIE